MKKAFRAVLFALLVLGATAASAQTTYNLPNSLCAFQASNYLMCSQMGTIRMATDTYSVTSSYTITSVYKWAFDEGPESGTFTGTLMFTRVSNIYYPQASVAVSGTFTVNPDGSHHILATEVGGWTGEFTLPVVGLAFDVVVFRQCGRGCTYRPNADNPVLTMN